MKSIDMGKLDIAQLSKDEFWGKLLLLDLKKRNFKGCFSPGNFKENFLFLLWPSYEIYYLGKIGLNEWNYHLNAMIAIIWF